MWDSKKSQTQILPPKGLLPIKSDKKYIKPNMLNQEIKRGSSQVQWKLKEHSKTTCWRLLRKIFATEMAYKLNIKGGVVLNCKPLNCKQTF